jgi:hypothetical protein
MKFKPGDKVFSFRHGIVTIVETEDAFTSGFSIGIKTEIGIEGHTREGRLLTIDKHPSVITLEEAEKRGFVRKRVTVSEELRVKYYYPLSKTYFVSVSRFNSKEAFEDNTYDCGEFVSFVDERLNECPPPQETIEWEEIKMGTDIHTIVQVKKVGNGLRSLEMWPTGETMSSLSFSQVFVAQLNPLYLSGGCLLKLQKLKGPSTPLRGIHYTN